MESVVLRFRPRDTSLPRNGPGGKWCGPGDPVDGAEFDGRFTCDCSATKYTGANCDSDSGQDGGGDTATVVVSAVFAVVLIVGIVAAVAAKLQARAVRNRPFDFKAELDRLLAAGVVVAADSCSTPSGGGGSDGTPATLLPREIKRSKVSLTEKLGKGAFGEVWKGVLDDQGNEYLVAVKTLLKETDDSMQEMMQEAVIMAQIGQHPHCVGVVGAVSAGSPKLLVLTFCEHGSLQGYLASRACAGSPLGEVERLRAAHDVALGMIHLGSKGVIHRDLAARNVLIDSRMRYKVADFGLSRGGAAGAAAGDSEEVYYRAKRSAFPVRWTPPEAMESLLFNSATDVWSYGVLLLEIYLDGGRPYGEMSNDAVIVRVAAGYRAPKPSACAAGVYVDVLLACWDSDALRRPSFARIADVLESCIAALGGDENAGRGGSAGGDARPVAATGTQLGHAAAAAGGVAGAYSTPSGGAQEYSTPSGGANEYSTPSGGANTYSTSGGGGGGAYSTPGVKDGSAAANRNRAWQSSTAPAQDHIPHSGTGRLSMYGFEADGNGDGDGGMAPGGSGALAACAETNQTSSFGMRGASTRSRSGSVTLRGFDADETTMEI